MLAAKVAKDHPHLILHWPRWQDRAICAAQDSNASTMVIGTDGNGECVFWVQTGGPPPRSSSPSTDMAPRSATSRNRTSLSVRATEGGGNGEGGKWECMNDGSCAPSSSSRAIFPTEPACLHSGCATTFECIKNIPSAFFEGAAYCLPVVPAQPGGTARPGNGKSFPTIGGCEASCVSAP